MDERARATEQPDLFDCGRVVRVRRPEPKNRHEVFASAMVKHLGNRTQAAKEAGFSAKTAYSQGSRLMRNPEVCKMVASKARKAVEQLDLSADRVLKEAHRIAYFDVRELYDSKGKLKPLHKLSDATAAAIASVETVNVGGVITHKVRTSDKVRCVELLAKYHKLLTDKVEHSGNIGVQLVNSVPRPQRSE